MRHTKKFLFVIKYGKRQADADERERVMSWKSYRAVLKFD